MEFLAALKIKKTDLKMDIIKSPRVVHFDAIHHTNLLNGVRVNYGSGMGEESDDRYHIQTICRQIAEEFFLNRESQDFVPCDFQRRPIQSIEVDLTFRDHALSEFLSRGIVEELPEVFPPRDALVGTLTDRLVEAFEESAMTSEQGFGILKLTQIREIRDDVLFRGSREEQRTSPHPRAHRIDGQHRPNREPAHLNAYLELIDLSKIQKVVVARQLSLPLQCSLPCLSS